MATVFGDVAFGGKADIRWQSRIVSRRSLRRLAPFAMTGQSDRMMYRSSAIQPRLVSDLTADAVQPLYSSRC